MTAAARAERATMEYFMVTVLFGLVCIGKKMLVLIDLIDRQTTVLKCGRRVGREKSDKPEEEREDCIEETHLQKPLI